MPATTVHVGLGLVIAAALLGEYYDRRSLSAVVLVLILPELDAIPGWWLPGAHRALFHTFVLATVAGGLLYYDTRLRETSWLRDRAGERGVYVAWVALAVHVLAHLLLDWAHLDGINVFYPITDQFYRLEGELVLSTSEGLVQTFVEFGEDGADAGRRGTTETVHVATPADPEPGRGLDREVERRVPIAVRGWQLYVLLLGVFTVGARRLQREPSDERQQ